MGSEVKVTIIMPSLNVEDYIDQALATACEQTLKNIEILCIDAGSTDGTWEIIQKYAERDKRVQAVRSNVRSYGFQCNLAIRMAKGEYIAILETDDYVSPDMYESLYEATIPDKPDYVKGDYYMVATGEDGRETVTSRKVSSRSYLYDTDITPVNYPETAEDDWYLWNGIYRTDFLKNNNILFYETPGASFQDIGFLHKVLFFALKGRYIHKNIYYYRTNRGGSSSNSGKDIAYAKQQYGLLLCDYESISNSKQLKLLYRRMVGSFVRACMYSVDSVLESEKGMIDCMWFSSKLIEAEKWGIIEKEDIPQGLYRAYLYLTRPVYGFLSYRKERNGELARFLEGGDPVIIFGCGVFGRNARELLKNLGISIYGFMDNDKNLQGSEINGIKVFSPEEFNSLPVGTKYVIANEKHANEIRSQLESICPDVKLFVYSPELICVKE